MRYNRTSLTRCSMGLSAKLHFANLLLGFGRKFTRSWGSCPDVVFAPIVISFLCFFVVSVPWGWRGRSLRFDRQRRCTLPSLPFPGGRLHHASSDATKPGEEAWCQRGRCRGYSPTGLLQGTGPASLSLSSTEDMCICMLYEVEFLAMNCFVHWSRKILGIAKGVCHILL